jgi:hypothetical protein
MLAVSIIFIAVGILISGFLAPFVYVKFRERKAWQKIEGITTRTDVELGRTRLYTPNYKFQVDGKTHTGKSSIQSTRYRRYNPGDPISVIYDENDPGKNDISSPAWAALHFLILFVGLFFGAFGWLGLKFHASPSPVRCPPMNSESWPSNWKFPRHVQTVASQIACRHQNRRVDWPRAGQAALSKSRIRSFIFFTTFGESACKNFST